MYLHVLLIANGYETIFGFLCTNNLIIGDALIYTTGPQSRDKEIPKHVDKQFKI